MSKFCLLQENALSLLLLSPSVQGLAEPYKKKSLTDLPRAQLRGCKIIFLLILLHSQYL